MASSTTLLFLNVALYRNSLSSTASALHLDPSGLFLTLEFNQTFTNEATLCEAILEPELFDSVASSYGKPKCLWHSDNKLRIYPPFGSNHSNPIMTTSPSSDYNPYIILEAPSMVNPCSDVIISVESILSK